MKPLLLTLLLALAQILHAETPRKVGEIEPLPGEGFSDLASLQKWSSTSSFGGGHAEKLEVAGQEIFYSMRSVTSGVATTELIFYGKRDGRILPRLIMPVHRAEYRVQLDGDTIVVQHWNSQAKTFTPALSLNPAIFQD